ncbi:FeoB-associated Cys-rich membrane protein [Emticicia sp. 17c]|uniref:FeoB-associated Cys-rich membrane protein n=1 Tax=Emticicia sp. 17c TaxID=3127704 RepID=UPI00301E56A5
MIENIIIGVVFLGALVYLGNMVRKQFTAKSAGCAKGCGTCQVDMSKFPTVKEQ